MDLELDGQDYAGSAGVGADGTIKQVLMIGMHMHSMAIGFGLDGALIQLHYLDGVTGHGMWDEIAIVDSTMTPIVASTSGWRIYASANRFTIQGNVLGNMLTSNSEGSHTVRIPYAEKAVISNNTIARAGVNQQALKLHSEAWCEVGYPADICTTYDTGNGSGPPPPSYDYLTNTHPIGIYASLSGYTEKVLISDNKIIGADNPYTISVAPQNPIRDERLRDVIVERNWFVAGAGTQLMMWVDAGDSTIRNNVFDMEDSSKYKTFIYLTPPGFAPPIDNVSVYNNTLYGGSPAPVSGNEFTGIRVDSTASNVRLVNNLVSAPTATNPIMISGTGATGFVESNNLLSQEVPSTLFVSATPAAPADFSLNPTSPARDTGLSTVPVLSDFFGASRPQNGTIDLGAIEGP